VSDPDGPVEAALAAALGHPVRIERRRALGGGDISQVERIQTDAGPFILKSHPSPPDGFFAAEAAGLAALRASGTSLRIPAVVAVADNGPAWLVLEDLGSGYPSDGFDEVFGRGLAELHRRGSDRFGFDQDTFCGTTRQPNARTARWVDFYGERRLGHQLELATRSGRLSSSDASDVRRLIERLDTLIDEPPEGPALIHGDLWSGNLHVSSAGAPSLIDPSAYFAHREAELGMMQLFGGFSTRVYDAYAEAFPLDAGWRERHPLYQLYHLLNHLNLFGTGYRPQVMAVIRRFA
jgi:fructosamine-3-kinase